MSVPVAIRFDEELLAEVRRVAKRRATSVSSMVQMFAEEGIRALQVPTIVFRDGPSGRRAGVAGSLDVWEIIEELRQANGPVDPAAVAASLGVDQKVVSAALDYYSQFPEEIDDWIAENEREAERAHAAWLREQSVLQGAGAP